MARLLPVHGVELDDAPALLADLFDPVLPVVLEVGPGMGDATAAMAADDPGTGIVAVDVHTPGIGALLVRVEALGLSNVRVCVGDAVDLMDRLAPQSLTGVRAYFPDPWPKSRHHKRRLVQPAFVRRAAELLVPGGALHLATDMFDYAEQMLDVCRAERLLEPEDAVLRDRPPWRPVTKFEARGIAEGRPSRDLIVRRRMERAPGPG